mgnify:CR=1 FL=1
MKKVLFHTGRGGRFYNSGYTTAEDVIEPFNPEYYGISVFSDEENPEIRLENGKVVCNLNDLDSDNGSFNIDNDFDSYHWVAFKDLDENDLEIIIRDLRTYEFKDELIESGVDENVFNFLEHFGKLKEYVSVLDLQTTWKDFKNYNEVLEFNSEGEAEEAEHFKVINIGDKYYTLD